MSQKLDLSARQPNGCRAFQNKRKPLLRLHPLFLLFGAYYAIKGDLFLFLLSALVALQHECAHAFASAKLGYKLNEIVLMPYGAILDGDLRGISLKDEIFVALCGPLCNLATACGFLALWWLTPTMYAFTDTAYYSSLSIALINLLPAYPLDGGRVLKCLLLRASLKKQADTHLAEKKAERVCRVVTLLIAGILLTLFLYLCFLKTPNFTILAFGIFLLVGAFGNPNKQAVYDKLDFSNASALEKGVEIRRVAVLENCTVKKALRFLTSGSFLVLDVYDKEERFLFSLSQNELAKLFLLSDSPYDSLSSLKNKSLSKKTKTPCKVETFVL